MKRFINVLSWVWLVAGISIGLFILRPSLRSSESHNSAIASLHPTGLPPRDYATRPIETLRVGDRVLARNPDVTDAEREAFQEPDWTTWRRASLEMTKPSGGILRIDLIRPKEWFQANDAAPGKLIFLDLPEMGAEGDAVVTSTSECPKIKLGAGLVITATFAHPPDEEVLNVWLEGESQPIGVTGNHLFWSVDALTFVPIGEMKIGDRTQSYSGDSKRIIQKLPRPGPQLVYNLEVYPEHVYFIGEQGILAHNEYVYAVRMKKSKDIIYIGKGTLGRTATAVDRVSGYTGIAASKLEMVKVKVGGEFVMRGMEQRALIATGKGFSPRGGAYKPGALANKQLSYDPARLNLHKNSNAYKRAKAFEDASQDAVLWDKVKQTFGL